jgi:zinc protease
MLTNWERVILDNGLHVSIEHRPLQKITTLQIRYNVGSKDEGEREQGVAHLVEHLMCRSHQFRGYINDIGGMCQGETWVDVSKYSSFFLNSYVEEVLEREANRMEALQVTRSEVESEKNIIAEEYFQGVEGVLYGDWDEQIQKLCYSALHPYYHSTYSMESMQQIPLQDILRFHQKHYGPNNAYLSLTTGLPASYVMDTIERCFSPLQPRKRDEKRISSDMKVYGKCNEIKTSERYSKVCISYHSPGINTPSHQNIDFFGDVLLSSEDSPLSSFLDYEFHLFPWMNHSLTTLSVVCENEEVDVALERIERAIEQLSFTEEQLETLKKGAYIRRQRQLEYGIGKVDLVNAAQHTGLSLRHFFYYICDFSSFERDVKDVFRSKKPNILIYRGEKK